MDDRRAPSLYQSLGDRYRVLVEQMADGVFLADADGRYIEVNEAAGRMLGYEREELVGRSLTDVLDPSEWARLPEFLWDLNHSTSCRGEWLYKRKDGTTFSGDLVGRRLPDGCYQGIVRDMSPIRKGEEALREKDRFKDEFLAMLAHELRNPLAPIQQATELMSRMVEPGTGSAALLSVIERQMRQLRRLVDDLLDVSRISQGRVTLQEDLIDVQAIVELAVETVSPLIEEKHQDLLLSLSPVPLAVKGDLVRLAQCVSNLLNNAAKYTPAGGNIELLSKMEEGQVVIEVRDDGAGIPAELLPRIFEMFVQSERTLDRAQGGLGIGLAVVKRLIEMHGGSVEARSVGSGAGSIFLLRLPRATAIAASVAVRSESPFTQRRVLIVDDNSDAADTLAMLLEMEGHRVTAVYSAQDGVEQAVKGIPDIVLLDLGLPEFDGFEVARRLRGVPALQHTRLVALSGYGRPEDQSRTAGAGFDDHLIKPVNFDLLADLLSRLEGPSQSVVGMN